MFREVPGISGKFLVFPGVFLYSVNTKGEHMKIYEGKSRFTGENGIIQALLTGYKPGQPSSNTKTGPVVQLHILVKDENPKSAQESGKDALVCGTCSLRPIKVTPDKKPCYVRTRGELSAWKAHREEVPTFNAVEIMSRMGLRLGAYGAPAMLPEKVIRKLCVVANKFRPNHTGFTQRWRLKSNQWLRFFCMASVGSVAEAKEAHDLGWRTFRTRSTGEPIEPGEISCPAAKESGRRTTCQQCVLCDGVRSGTDARKHITILYH